MFTRRMFLKGGGIAFFALGVAGNPSFLTRTAEAATGTAASSSRKRKVLVTLFQRGAMDGLAAVPPVDDSLKPLRPRLALSAAQGQGSTEPGLLDLQTGFGLHPGFAPLLPLWQERQLAIVHAVGSPDPTRSHFDAQDFMESGTPGLKSTEDGWLNRALETVPEENASPFRAVAMGPNLPRMLHGVAPAIALPDLKQFRVMAQAPGTSQMVEGGFEAMYSQTVDHALHGTGTETFEAIDLLRKADPGKYQPENGAQYPTSRLGQSLRQIGQLLKANTGVEVL